jgi:outer membrane immunogenic protein
MSRKFRVAVLMATAAVVSSASAFAAGDTWKGFYGGISAGFTSVNSRIYDTEYDWNGSSSTYVYGGTQFGGQVGWNWQTKNVGYGAEFDLFGATAQRDFIYDTEVAVPMEMDWTASLRARSGLAFGQAWLYQTLGVAGANFERSWTEFDDVPDSWPDLGDTKYGAVYGFGIEQALSGNWSFKVEGTATKYFDNSATNPLQYTFDIDDTVFAMKVGFNRQFGADRKTDSAIVAGNAFDFSGFFAGVHLGGHESTVSLSDISYGDFGGTQDLLAQGVVGGLQAGYNVQDRGFLYGAELALSWTGGELNESYGNTPATDYFRVVRAGLNYTGELKLKAGLAADNTLMYLAGGLAFADYDAIYLSGSSGNVPPINDAWDVSGTYLGAVVSAGLEQAITPNLTWRAEASFAAYDGDSALDSVDLDEPVRGHATDVSIKAGLNYYFGDRGGWGTGAEAPGNWRGFFAGLDGLFAYHQGGVFDQAYYEHGADYIVPSFGAGLGVNAGFNWQDGSFVYGLIADVALYSNDESDVAVNDRQIDSSLNWMGSVRGRAGVATGLGHMFATAGVAFAGVDRSHLYLPLPDTDSFLFDDARFGWTAGLGVERQVGDRASVKFEALYTSFGQEAGYNQDTCSGPFLPAQTCEMQSIDDVLTLKVGYTYKLTGE